MCQHTVQHQTVGAFVGGHEVIPRSLCYGSWKAIRSCHRHIWYMLPIVQPLHDVTIFSWKHCVSTLCSTKPLVLLLEAMRSSLRSLCHGSCTTDWLHSSVFLPLVSKESSQLPTDSGTVQKNKRKKSRKKPREKAAGQDQSWSVVVNNEPLYKITMPQEEEEK